MCRKSWLAGLRVQACRDSELVVSPGYHIIFSSLAPKCLRQRKESLDYSRLDTLLDGMGK